MAPEVINSRVLVIGIEGATWRTLTPAIELGYMPFLRHLVNRGASGTLFSTIPASTAPAWASFLTGRNPGSTGVFCSTLVDRTAGETHAVDSGSIESPIWDEVGRSGRRLAILNVPLSWPPRQVNGVMVAAPPATASPSELTWPPEVAEELAKSVPHIDPPQSADCHAQAPYKDIESYVTWAMDAVRSKTAVAEHIIFTRSPDLAIVHFDACDKLQHALWCYLDPADPLYDEEKQLYIFEHFYGGLDQAIKDTCDAFTRAASGEVSVLVVSDHGFELHRKRFNMGSWLFQQGLLQVRAGSGQPGAERDSLFSRLLRLLRLRPLPRKADPHLAATPQAVDWQTSPTLLVGDGDEAGVYLLSENDAHRRNTMTRITKGLKAMRDPFTSAPIARAIYRKEELYRGPKMDMMPDLVLVPAAGYSFVCDGPADGPLIEDVSQDLDRQLGKHHPEGIIVACGPGIADKIGIAADLVDAVPTILYLLGLAIPPSCDGKVAMDIFTEDFVASRGLPRTEQG